MNPLPEPDFRSSALRRVGATLALDQVILELGDVDAARMVVA